MPAEQITTGLPQPQGLGEEPLYHFTRVYLLFLQGLFKQFDSGSYRWSEDEKLSEVSITDNVPFPKDKIEQRPAIVTMRGPAQFGNLSLDNLKSLDWHTGSRRHDDIVSCTMSIHCISKTGVEAQRLAWIVGRHLRIFSRMLQQQGRFHKVGYEVSIGPESPPGSLIDPEPSPTMTLVTVFSPFHFKWTEVVTPQDAPLLQNVEAHIAAGLIIPAATTTAAQECYQTKMRPPTIRGLPIGAGSPIEINRPIRLTVKS